MSAKSFACGADGCRLDPQPPGTGNDGVMRYPRYSECMQSCGPTAATPMPGQNPNADRPNANGPNADTSRSCGAPIPARARGILRLQ